MRTGRFLEHAGQCASVRPSAAPAVSATTDYLKSRFPAFVFSLLFLTVFAMYPARAIAEEENPAFPSKRMTVTGALEKAAIDERGKVIAVEIWAEAGESTDYYLVNDDAKGNELLAFAGKRITATGIVEEDEDGNKIISVQAYTLLK